MKRKNKIGSTNLRNAILFGIFCTVVVFCIGLYILLKLNPYMIINYDGYAVSGEQLTENLLSGIKITNENRNIQAINVKDQSTIYKNIHSYYIGDDKKTNLNIDYPIYINGNISLYNISSDTKMITNYYEELDGYANSSIVSGTLYNMYNMERADYNKYIFLKTPDEIFISTYDINLKTSESEYTIPMNSIIKFTEDYILYYILDEELFVYNEILDVDSSTQVKIGEFENITYNTFLEKLNIIEIREEIVEEIKEPEIIIEKKINIIPKEEIIEDEIIEEPEEEKEKIEEIVEQVPETKPEENSPVEVIKYIKPEVSCKEFESNVYSAKTSLKIYDPTKRIKTPVSFTIMNKGKVYLRKSFLSSGNYIISGLLPDQEYTIIGEYTYLNENEEIVKNIFLEEKIKTGSIDSLNPIQLNFEYGDILSDGIHLKNLKIESSLIDESLRGLKKAYIEIDGATYTISTEKLNKMLMGQNVDFKVTNILKSNSEYDFKIVFFDLENNELELENNTGIIRTSKKAPSAKIKLNVQKVVNVNATIQLENKDNLNITDYKYYIYLQDGTIVQSNDLNINDAEIILENLDPNNYYIMKIYGTFDLEDGRGIQENIEIGEATFTTAPINLLGYIYLKNDIVKLEKNKFNMSLDLLTNKTDERLIHILEDIKINLYNKNTGDLAQTQNLSKQQLESFKTGIQTIIEFRNLQTSTEYNIEIEGTAVQGTTKNIIKVVCNTNNIITRKEPAKVLLKNKFVTNKMIDFDVKIQDIDKAILTDNISFELRNKDGKLVDIESIDINADYKRLNFDKLESEQEYYISFYAIGYNEGADNSTYQSNYLLSKISFYTQIGISGKVELQDLTRQTEGKNLIDVSSTIKWYSACFNTSKYYGNTFEYDRNEKSDVLKLYAGKSSANQYYSYDFSQYIGQTVTFSFDAKKEANSSGLRAYLQTTKAYNAKNVKEITNLSTSEWNHYIFTITIDDTGFAGFYVSANSSANSQYLWLKNVQVELGKSASSYKKYQYSLESNIIVNLDDTRDEVTTNDYYLRFYKNGKYDKEEKYIEIDETNKVTNSIKKFVFEDNKNYKIELAVKINDRYYVLNTLEFDTEIGEMLGISCKEDWLKVQPNGNYIVYADIDFSEVSNSYVFGGSNLFFNGVIDFQRIYYYQKYIF